MDAGHLLLGRYGLRSGRASDRQICQSLARHWANKRPGCGVRGGKDLEWRLGGAIRRDYLVKPQNTSRIMLINCRVRVSATR